MFLIPKAREKLLMKKVYDHPIVGSTYELEPHEPPPPGMYILETGELGLPELSAWTPEQRFAIQAKNDFNAEGCVTTICTGGVGHLKSPDGRIIARLYRVTLIPHPGKECPLGSSFVMSEGSNPKTLLDTYQPKPDEVLKVQVWGTEGLIAEV